MADNENISREAVGTFIILNSFVNEDINNTDNGNSPKLE
jgi:hypothetical protein